MTKANLKIIKGCLNSTQEKFSKVGYVDGYYYATDGYRMVRCEENPELPTFTYREIHPNYKYMMNTDKEFTTINIPYTAKQVKEWYKEYKKKSGGLKTPFVLGFKGRFWLGINPKFLIDAMETTGSSEIKCENGGASMVVEGNGFLWKIMAVALQGWDKDKHMTEIGVD